MIKGYSIAVFRQIVVDLLGLFDQDSQPHLQQQQQRRRPITTTTIVLIGDWQQFEILR